ncbi:hypothetical protein HZQ14_15955 [Elizabethkingia anophelis]|nr:hypothetical protein [Elizabethkingia anophelis]
MKLIKPLIISSIIAFGFWLTNVLFMKQTATDITVTVNDKKRIWETNKFMVYTDKEPFECIDQQMLLRFNRGEIYESIEPGKKYKMKIYGWNVPFFNWYRKIESVQSVN